MIDKEAVKFTKHVGSLAACPLRQAWDRLLTVDFPLLFGRKD